MSHGSPMVGADNGATLVADSEGTGAGLHMLLGYVHYHFFISIFTLEYYCELFFQFSNGSV
jgi:hypothetical protein